MLLLGRLLPPAARSAAREPTATLSGPITVQDGDTLALPDGRRVRLPGVDCPETGRHGAAQATSFSARFVAGHVIELLPADPPRDHYGRLLADVLADGRSLSEALVAQGLAWVYPHAAALPPTLITLQARAVARELGVHARLDRAGPPPFLVQQQRFHRADCPSVSRSAARLPCTSDVRALLAAGRSPCRSCLPWPP